MKLRWLFNRREKAPQLYRNPPRREPGWHANNGGWPIGHAPYDLTVGEIVDLFTRDPAGRVPANHPGGNMTSTDTPTKLDLDAIKARHFAARDGEWKVNETHDDGTAVVYIDHESIRNAVTVLFEADWGELADAEFIAHSHQDVPALVAEVERLRDQISRARDALTEYGRNAMDVSGDLEDGINAEHLMVRAENEGRH